ncbi:fimbria/pilus periplasmic chaperone [Photobacterium leiognathi]|uniref:fimbria/pilus periplasmic chaperone n=1 Tax=Photobacterium leiognathi TaxID=553611 RepID=UPI0027341243|nr:fimbria/pilus periplasmic chaperone [Photobacterium leiognathi]
MNKLYLLMILSLFYTSNAVAAFSLNSTRYVYIEGNKSIAVQISNDDKKTFGGQIWIDNIHTDPSDVAFIVSPSFFKINGGLKQVARIMNVSNKLAKDQESIFWLNVLEIPPKSEKEVNNALQFAVNTKVKLIYRPKSIANSRLDAEKNLTYSVDYKGSVVLKNTTPYIFAVTSVNAGETKLNLTMT